MAKPKIATTSLCGCFGFPPQRMEDPLGTVDPLEIAVHLRAEEALREGVSRVASESHRAVLFDVDAHHAGVGAVVGADHLQASPPVRLGGLRHLTPGCRTSGSRVGAGLVTDGRRAARRVHRDQDDLGLGHLDLLAPPAAPPLRLDGHPNGEGRAAHPDRLREEVDDVAEEDRLVELDLAHGLEVPTLSCIGVGFLGAFEKPIIGPHEHVAQQRLGTLQDLIPASLKQFAVLRRLFTMFHLR